MTALSSAAAETPEAKAIEATIGHHFSNRQLLARALTHASLSGSGVRDLERLEFLGDRVLGLLTAEELWHRFPNMDEGDMALRLNALVRKETCADAARAWNVGPALQLSVGEEKAGGRNKDAILGDVCEALLGAIYVDGGLDAAKKAYATYWVEKFDSLTARPQDAKTALQEWAQDRGFGTPRYVDISREGPDHSPTFTVEVVVASLEPERASGSNKRAAQTEAAEKILLREKVWSDDR